MIFISQEDILEICVGFVIEELEGHIYGKS